MPVYMHKLELKHAFYAVATKTDLGVYLLTYLRFDINWQPMRSDTTVLAQGVALCICPGHTLRLCTLQLNLRTSGTWIVTSDHYIVQENYHNLTPQGWLTREHPSWSRSNQEVHLQQKTTCANIIFGHDRAALMKHKLAPDYHESNV